MSLYIHVSLNHFAVLLKLLKLAHCKLTIQKKGEKASLVTQTVKNLPDTQETQVQSLGREDPLQKEMATHSRILAGESHGQRSLVGHSSSSHKELNTTEVT